MKKEKTTKITSIQLLRALAVMAVTSYHFFTRKTELTFTVDTYKIFPFTYGWMGVNLFFIISGFVITLTLEKTNNLLNFLKRRFLRIFPALWVCLPLVYLFQKYSPNSPYVPLCTPTNLIFSMVMFPPNIINFLFGTHINWVTIVLWTLKIELIFYVVYGFMYFKIGKKTLNIFKSITIISILLEFLGLVDGNNFIFKHINMVFKMLGFNYYIWFTVGITLYKYFVKQIKSRELYKWQFILFSSTFVSKDILYSFSALILILTVNIVIRNERNLKVPAAILAIGESSYEMYLIHQGIGQTTLIMIANKLNLNFIWTSVASVAMILLSYLLSNIIFLVVSQLVAKSFYNRKKV